MVITISTLMDKAVENKQEIESAFRLAEEGKFFYPILQVPMSAAVVRLSGVNRKLTLGGSEVWFELETDIDSQCTNVFVCAIK